jgi:hypothetical protein
VLQRTIVYGYYFDGYKATVDGGVNQLADGAHTLVVSATDRDNNVTTATSTFQIHTSAPVTTLTSAPTGMQTKLPIDSLGRFTGTTISGNGQADGPTATGAHLKYLKAVVTTPLGQTVVYQFAPSPSNNTITVATSRNWSFGWVAPVDDPRLAVPGNYTVSIVGVDATNNTESATTANTATFMVV